jgi:DNA-binding CsgD family transcriptional regulator
MENLIMNSCRNGLITPIKILIITKKEIEILKWLSQGMNTNKISGKT